MAGKKASKIRRNQARAAARGETYTYIPPSPKQGDENNRDNNSNNSNNVGNSKENRRDDEAIQRRATAAQKLEETLARLETNPDNLNSKEKRTAKRKAEAIALEEARGGGGDGSDGGDGGNGDGEAGGEQTKTWRCDSAEELLTWYREYRKRRQSTNSTDEGRKKRTKRKHVDGGRNDDEPPKLLSEEDQRKFLVAKQLHDALAALENDNNHHAIQDGNEVTATTPTTNMNAKERRSAKRKAEAIASEQTGCSPEDLLQWYEQHAPKQPQKNSSVNADHNENNNHKKKIPYIVFVGQLSYKTTVESLRNHFLSILSPDSFPNRDASLLEIRLLTDPKTKTSRGMAFVELPTPELMYESLKLHMTHLDGRRINVERSSGGGKHSSLKKSKIQSFREKQSEYISKTVDGIIESFVRSGEVDEEELDDGVRGLCKRHSVQVVERALKEFV
ncbi:hypothetical protein ACHAXS_007389 [Conticribra weissflogii]